jgi:thioredoxin 1
MKKTVFFCTILLIGASTRSIHASLTIIQSEDQFNKIVNADKPSVVVFSAEWCGGCKALKEPFQKVVDNPMFKHITFAKVDVDKFESLSQKYHIRYLPTIFFMQAGEKKHEIIGRESERYIGDAINKIFAAKKELTEAMQSASAETKEKLKAATQEFQEAAHNMEEVIAETKREATTTEPVESAGPFQMVWNIIASIFISIKDLIVNFFSSIASFFKNLF